MNENIKKVLAELGIEQSPEELVKTPTGLALLDAINTMNTKRKELVHLGEQVTAIAERVTAKATSEPLPRPNSLGELQSTGQAFDTACTALTAAQQTVTVLADLVKQTS